MAKLPNVYYITIKNGYGVIKNPNGTYEFDVLGDATLFLEDEIDNELEVVRHFFDKNAKIMDADKDYVRSIATNYFRGIDKIGNHEQLYPPKLVSRLVDCLKDEKDNLIKLNDAFKVVSNSNEKKEDNNMSEKREDVAVRFYEGMISKEIINFKKGDSTIKMKRIKLPNDDPNDSQVRRSFLVKESAIGTDLKNPHMKYVYLGKDAEYKVVRKNFDPETKKAEILEESKMTGQAIADTFKAERDRGYAEWKAQQPAESTNEFNNPDVELATEDDVTMDM